MTKIPFKKMHGCGNDFIVIDNRYGIMKEFDLSSFAKLVCTRKFNVGADGLILLENSNITDVKMKYFNSDGSEGEMCGNGARCFVKYAFLKGAIDNTVTFETLDGIYEGAISNDNVKIKFPSIPVEDFNLNERLHIEEGGDPYHFAWMGVPHTVFISSDIEAEKDSEFIEWARPIRYNKMVSKNGANVNKIEVLNKNQIKIRTYERGVEEETFACGSGSVASAITSSLLGEVSSPVQMQTKGGVLTVSFRIKEDHVEDIVLEGNAIVVAEGKLHLDV